MAANAIEEAVIATLRELPAEKQQAVLEFAKNLSPDSKRPRKSARGLWTNKGFRASEQVIVEARKAIAPLASLDLGEGSFFASETIQQLAAKQGVEPLKSIHALGGVLAKEEVADFLAAILEARESS
ncbi:MAG: hypothetical protein HYX27_05100 [Acidobacteria bacterium]|nr:hypothetical protein [Acidobacteriota bacterium]